MTRSFLLLPAVITAAAWLGAPAPGHAATASVVYAFKPAEGPYSGLTRLGTTLYGATEVGGSTNSGTVYALTKNGQYKLVYSSPGSGAGSPTGRLLAYKGVLYGITFQSVFKITPAGSYTTLYTFEKRKEGYELGTGLSELGGIFYGTSLAGGGSGDGCRRGCGTVFSITPAGIHTKLYTFMGAEDGYAPSELVAGAGRVFGTTPFEGTIGYGTVFSVTPDGVKTVLHNFEGGANGGVPTGRLYYRNGALYGAANGGDTTGACGSLGCGLVYKLTLSGKYTVLHTFEGTDGVDPTGGLIDLKGTLYGTTVSGGPGQNGVIYGIDPSGAFSLVYGFSNEGPVFLNEGLATLDGSLYGTSYRSTDRSKKCEGIPCGTAFKVTP